ncbi:MAG: SusD/RagB family nutrient-binding outer membrane lipoprotein, partial [Cytophagales bacterium]
VLDANVNADGFFAQDAKQPLITFYENQLILAESYARQNSTANAVAALNSVRQSLRTGYINGKTISTTNLAKGIKYDPYVAADFATQNALIYEIVLTKYMVTLSQYESFNDVRRLAKASPIVKLPVTPIVTTRTNDIPGRFVYPIAEVNTNPNIATVSDQFEKLPIFK